MILACSPWFLLLLLLLLDAPLAGAAVAANHGAIDNALVDPQIDSLQSVTAQRLQFHWWFILLESVCLWLMARLLMAWSFLISLSCCHRLSSPYCTISLNVLTALGALYCCFFFLIFVQPCKAGGDTRTGVSSACLQRAPQMAAKTLTNVSVKTHKFHLVATIWQLQVFSGVCFVYF